jgi:peptidoglycan lytic transglycosylase
MWGKLASDQQTLPVFAGPGWSSIAPHLLAALLAASIVCAMAASAKASTADADKAGYAGSLTSRPDRPAMGQVGRAINPIASDATAELLQAKLAPAPELLAHWRFRDLFSRSTLVGAASTYNPSKADDRSGGIQTSSGEIYEANAWAAAIQIDLRHAFGGVRYGRSYRPVFALVSVGEKCAIVRINDVGPLRPGRIIDLTERTMRYFDATLQRGVLANAKITPLDGTDWRSGPLEDGPALPMAGDVLPATIH